MCRYGILTYTYLIGGGAVSQHADYSGNHGKRKRRAQAFSQEASAEKTVLSVPSRSEIERGIAHPALLTLEKIAAAPCASVSGLLYREGRSNIPLEEPKKRVTEQFG
jgi:transcriptional regulator with XRE-family HTH domain